MNLALSLARFAGAHVASGRFRNASEVVRLELRLLLQRQQKEALKLQALRQAVSVIPTNIVQNIEVIPARSPMRGAETNRGDRTFS